MKPIIYLSIVLLLTGLVSCEMFEPIDENRLTTDYVASTPETAEGLLLQAYTGLIDQYTFSEVGTDDAVSNQLNNGYRRMANGELSAQFNPASRWQKYEKVFFINKFFEILDIGEIQWHRDDTINILFDERFRGEAFALRGLYHFYILQTHAGLSGSGEVLGIPYFTEFIPSEGNFNVPRLSFEASVEAVNNDFEEALKFLPIDYSDDAADVPARYADIDFGKYKIVNGAQNNQRISGRIVKALQARLFLFAASPSFLNDGGYYEKAARTAAEVLNTIGGVSGLNSNGHLFYKKDIYLDTDELLWRSPISGNISWLEEANFPPSKNGKGNINPTQNLVDAFPMRSGYPATTDNGYDPQDPYANRDERLGEYIVYNGSRIGIMSKIYTGVGAGVDRLDSISELSTRTGYYLKKLLHPNVRISDDGTATGKKHINVYFRYTELFLILAEAANEIGGPDHIVEGISARDVLGAIRERAKITQPDAYLSSINSKEDMRELIRNERRIELSFEGHRFYDMRRWGLPLNETATGYFHDGAKYVDVPGVEERNYPSHANYLPIPYNELVKYSELVQNLGW